MTLLVLLLIAALVCLVLGGRINFGLLATAAVALIIWLLITKRSSF